MNSSPPKSLAPRPALRRPDVDADWADLRGDWEFRPGVTYLNHGSFGPSPAPVRAAQAEWQWRLQSNPMDFYVREYEAAYAAARERLASFVGAAAGNLAFVENATYGMNVVAHGFPLGEGDEVLLTDHEYGAVLRIWQRKCDRVGAKVTTATLPYPPVEKGDSPSQATRIPRRKRTLPKGLSPFSAGCYPSDEESRSAEPRAPRSAPRDSIVDAVDRAITPRTKLLVLSHITSPTAVILPAAELCKLAGERGVRTCIDGPHAVATLPLALDALGCDYYTASCHKWLCAPFGSGFLYVHPRRRDEIDVPVLSWGRLQPAVPAGWADELTWQGTRDPSAYLSVPAAIDYLEAVGIEAYRQRTHHLARYARGRIEELTGLEAFVPDDAAGGGAAWYGSMIALPLPAGDGPALQRRLREAFGIETPVVTWADRRFVRVSAHLYTTTADVDHLVASLDACLRDERAA